MPFGAAPGGVMFQKKIDELFSGMPNAFSIAYDILIAGCDKQSTDHDETLDKVLWVCRQATLKLYKDKCLFMCTSIPFSGEVIFPQGLNPDLRKVKALTDMPPTKSKKELHHFLVY